MGSVTLLHREDTFSFGKMTAAPIVWGTPKWCLEIPVPANIPRKLHAVAQAAAVLCVLSNCYNAHFWGVRTPGTDRGTAEAIQLPAPGEKGLFSLWAKNSCSHGSNASLKRANKSGTTLATKLIMTVIDYNQ